MTDFKFLSNKNILVTGASGFIGSALTTRLLGYGANVFGVTRNISSDQSEDLTWLESNLLDIDDVERIIELAKK